MPAYEMTEEQCDLLAAVAWPLWDALEGLGWTDSWGGMEFRRVFPEAIRFIRHESSAYDAQAAKPPPKPLMIGGELKRIYDTPGGVDCPSCALNRLGAYAEGLQKAYDSEKHGLVCLDCFTIEAIHAECATKREAKAATERA